MRWEITVTTHLFVTCRTGFHSAAGEVASRPGRGGPTWGRVGGRASVPTPRSTRPAPDFPCPACSRLQTRVSEGAGTEREGRATLFAPALARSVGDDIKLAQQAQAQPGAPRAPGEAQSRRAGTRGPGPNPAARDPQSQGEQFLVQRRGICWAPSSCEKAREARGARGPGGSDAPVNPKLEPAFRLRERLNCPESNLIEASTLAYGRAYSSKLSWS